MPPKSNARGPRPIVKSEDKLILLPNLISNLSNLSFLRTFVSIIAGISVGICGVSGWSGFIYHFISQFLCIPLLLLKGCNPPKDYFQNWTTFATAHVFSSMTILSYILFWMIFYNLCHVF